LGLRHILGVGRADACEQRQDGELNWGASAAKRLGGGRFHAVSIRNVRFLLFKAWLGEKTFSANVKTISWYISVHSKVKRNILVQADLSYSPHFATKGGNS
jgi:hypothetical protein